ncbi:MAG: methyltransferase domain-containing protein [Anaerolineales bacterium]|nr:methyltransferase domain-containing protein [Anaerolineales bacterium]
MPSCQCQGIEAVFDQAQADRKLREYHRKGPAATTRLLVEALRTAGVEGRTLLDIGGGVGAIQWALLAAGAREAVGVDASSAHIATARREAERQGVGGRVNYVLGDFVALAGAVAAADIVTLDRVICCYDDMPGLVRLSAQHARQLYGLVYPQDAGWMRLGARAANGFQRLTGSAFRVFVHATAGVEALLREDGLRRVYYRRSGLWQVGVYAR